MGHPPSFLRLPSNTFHDLGSVGELKKKKFLNFKNARSGSPGAPASMPGILQRTQSGHKISVKKNLGRSDKAEGRKTMASSKEQKLWEKNLCSRLATLKIMGK